jgi:hypothetical protein
MSSLRKTVTAIATIAIVVCAATVAFAVTGDDILGQMEDAFSIGGANTSQGILLTIGVHNQYPSGITTDYDLAVAAKTASDGTSHVLMYFMGGEDEGMIFLLSTPKAQSQSEKSRMWLYISSFGLTKELVSEKEQSGNFAGSTLTYTDIAGAKDLRDHYNATILREDTVTVGDEQRSAWVLELTPKPDASVDYSRVLLWVDQDAKLLLRLEGYNASGEEIKEIVVERLGTFEDRRIPEVTIGKDLVTGEVSAMTLSGVRKPTGDLPDSVFDPKNLASFDPKAYGF